MSYGKHQYYNRKYSSGQFKSMQAFFADSFLLSLGQAFILAKDKSRQNVYKYQVINQ